MRAIPREVTIRLLMDWPVNGLYMKGWIINKDARMAAILVAAKCAEYVPFGTEPPIAQLEWAQSMTRAMQ